MSNAQIEFSANKHDFGKMDAYATRTVDIDITNNSSEKVFILRIVTERQVRYLYSNQTIQPNSSIQLRLKVNPADKGKFRSEVMVYHSASREPFTIVLKGEMDERPADSSPDCPDFSGNTTMAEQMEFDFKIKVIDKFSRLPIDKATVKIVKDGRAAFTWKTNRHGKIEKRFPLGYYYFVAEADNYFSNELAAFVNRKNHTLIIELTPFVKDDAPILAEQPETPIDDKPDDPVETPEETPEPENPETFEEIVLEIEPSEETEQPEETLEEDPQPVVHEVDNKTEQYVANNIVFVVDVSASMSLHGKLDLLKASMLELLDVLRPEDMISLVAFAEEAEILVEPIAATSANKSFIESEIKSLKAGGKTNGGQGIRKAYSLARKSYIEGGNNAIIMATDGSFNQYDRGFTKAIELNVKKGIYMSIAGVKAREKAEVSMLEIAELGHGRYVKIMDYNSALGALKQEIKDASKAVRQ